MLALKKYQNKKIAIYGMGTTGLSVEKVFRKSKAKIYCWDDNQKVRSKLKELNYPISKFWLNKDLIDRVVISPGIDINKCKIKKFLKKNINKIITDLDLFFELHKDSKIISITGTNGKSTTCKIIEKILRTAKYNVKTVGNIGTPILSTKRIKRKTIYIIEVSSYQLQYSKIFRSKHAVILNISPDHLERHKNMKNYINTKAKVFLAQNSSDFSYINSENKYFKTIKNFYKRKKIKSKLICVKKSNCIFLLKKITNKYFKIKGNIENLAFSYRIAKNLKIKNEVVIRAINQFKGLPHRQEVVFSDKKTLCINDSKATSFDASLQSLMSYNNIYWIVGGLPKKNDHFYLKKVKRKIIKAYIIGKKNSFFKTQIKNEIPFVVSGNLREAINDIVYDIKLNRDLKKNTILLSPAAASFDQFQNFENRGTYFKDLILKKFKRKKNVNF